MTLRIVWSSADATGRTEIDLDVETGAFASEDAPAQRTRARRRGLLPPETRERLRILALAVRPEHGAAQTVHITCASEEHLRIHLDHEIVTIDADLIDAGPPAILVLALGEAVRGGGDPSS